MIDESYFNGERRKRFDAIVAKTRNILNVVMKNEVQEDRDKVMLERYQMERVSKVVGSDYLVPFRVDAKKIAEVPGVFVEYEVPGNFSADPDKLEIRRQSVKLNYSLLCHVVNSLFGEELIVSQSGVYPSVGFIPPSPYQDRMNGQLKITVDTVLSVDDMMVRMPKDKYRILVIGSGSPGGVRSGVAYSLIPYMCNARVDMYDPYEVSRSYSVSSEKYKVEYVVYGKAFNYLDLKKQKFKDYGYDLVLDDSWTKGMSRNERDVDDDVLSIPHFSIKQFPWEEPRPGNVYIQKFFTEGLEQRRVSRDVKKVSPVERKSLGTCVACRELRLRLQGFYNVEFFSAFMNAHSVNCVTGSKHPIEVISQFEGWIEVKPFVLDFDNYCSMNYDYFPGSKMIGITFKGLKDVRVLYSNKENVSDRVLNESSQVLVCERTGRYFVNRLISEVPIGRKEVVQKVGLVTLSQSTGIRDKRDNLNDEDVAVSDEVKANWVNKIVVEREKVKKRVLCCVCNQSVDVDSKNCAVVKGQYCHQYGCFHKIALCDKCGLLLSRKFAVCGDKRYHFECDSDGWRKIGNRAERKKK